VTGSVGEAPQPQRARVTHAQNGEDVRAWRALQHVDEPFYVEVGASDPVVDSVTASLSAEGWHGILVEPEPVAAQALTRARPRDVVVAAAASGQAGIVTFRYGAVRGQGQVSPGVTTGAEQQGQQVIVPSVRLADVLDGAAPAAVHFMTIDVEGHEKQAIEGLELRRWRPWVLCIEATLPDSRTPAWQNWEPLLTAADYIFVASDGLNRWYVAAEHDELAPVVAEPFNVLDEILDGWRRSTLEEALAQVAGLTVEVQDVKEQSARAAAQSAEALAAAREEAALVRQEATLASEELKLVRSRADALEKAAGEARQEAQHLLRELGQTRLELATVTEREQVLLASKSWRLTSPLRAARLRASLAVTARGAGGSTVTPSAPPAVSEVDSALLATRRTALRARLLAADHRASLA
jgi:FkbM family methyltransferase